MEPKSIHTWEIWNTLVCLFCKHNDHIPKHKSLIPKCSLIIIAFCYFFKGIIESNHCIFHLKKLSSFYFRQSLNMNWPTLNIFQSKTWKEDCGWGGAGRGARQGRRRAETKGCGDWYWYFYTNLPLRTFGETKHSVLKLV